MTYTTIRIEKDQKVKQSIIFICLCAIIHFQLYGAERITTGLREGLQKSAEQVAAETAKAQEMRVQARLQEIRQGRPKPPVIRRPTTRTEQIPQEINDLALDKKWTEDQIEALRKEQLASDQMRQVSEQLANIQELQENYLNFLIDLKELIKKIDGDTAMLEQAPSKDRANLQRSIEAQRALLEKEEKDRATMEGTLENEILRLKQLSEERPTKAPEPLVAEEATVGKGKGKIGQPPTQPRPATPPPTPRASTPVSVPSELRRAQPPSAEEEEFVLIGGREKKAPAPARAPTAPVSAPAVAEPVLSLPKGGAQPPPAARPQTPPPTPTPARTPLVSSLPGRPPAPAVPISRTGKVTVYPIGTKKPGEKIGTRPAQPAAPPSAALRPAQPVTNVAQSTIDRFNQLAKLQEDARTRPQQQTQLQTEIRGFTTKNKELEEQFSAIEQQNLTAKQKIAQRKQIGQQIVKNNTEIAQRQQQLVQLAAVEKNMQDIQNSLEQDRRTFQQEEQSLTPLLLSATDELQSLDTISQAESLPKGMKSYQQKLATAGRAGAAYQDALNQLNKDLEIYTIIRQRNDPQFAQRKSALEESLVEQEAQLPALHSDFTQKQKAAVDQKAAFIQGQAQQRKISEAQAEAEFNARLQQQAQQQLSLATPPIHVVSGGKVVPLPARPAQEEIAKAAQAQADEEARIKKAIESGSLMNYLNGSEAGRSASVSRAQTAAAQDITNMNTKTNQFLAGLDIAPADAAALRQPIATIAATEGTAHQTLADVTAKRAAIADHNQQAQVLTRMSDVPPSARASFATDIYGPYGSVGKNSAALDAQGAALAARDPWAIEADNLERVVKIKQAIEGLTEFLNSEWPYIFVTIALIPVIGYLLYEILAPANPQHPPRDMARFVNRLMLLGIDLSKIQYRDLEKAYDAMIAAGFTITTISDPNLLAVTGFRPSSAQQGAQLILSRPAGGAEGPAAAVQK